MILNERLLRVTPTRLKIAAINLHRSKCSHVHTHEVCAKFIIQLEQQQIQ